MLNKPCTSRVGPSSKTRMFSLQLRALDTDEHVCACTHDQVFLISPSDGYFSLKNTESSVCAACDYTVAKGAILPAIRPAAVYCLASLPMHAFGGLARTTGMQRGKSFRARRPLRIALTPVNYFTPSIPMQIRGVFACGRLLKSS